MFFFAVHSKATQERIVRGLRRTAERNRGVSDSTSRPTVRRFNSWRHSCYCFLTLAALDAGHHAAIAMIRSRSYELIVRLRLAREKAQGLQHLFAQSLRYVWLLLLGIALLVHAAPSGADESASSDRIATPNGVARLTGPSFHRAKLSVDGKLVFEGPGDVLELWRDYDVAGSDAVLFSSDCSGSGCGQRHFYFALLKRGSRPQVACTSVCGSSSRVSLTSRFGRMVMTPLRST